MLSGFFFLLLSCFYLSLSNLVSTVPIWLSVDATSNSISSVERCPSQLEKIASRVHTGYTAIAPSDLAREPTYSPTTEWPKPLPLPAAILKVYHSTTSEQKEVDYLAISPLGVLRLSCYLYLSSTWMPIPF